MSSVAQDLTGKRAIVTGANSGIGLEAARELARAGAHVVLACRNATKAQTALSDITSTVPGADVVVGELDLSQLESVSTFASGFDGPLDILVNNAGVMMVPNREVSPDGFELQFATNYLGHFALTSRLLPQLRATADPVVVSLSSIAHYAGSIHFDDLQLERYGSVKAYAQSKLATLMFALELDRRAKAKGWCLRSNAAHPGFSRTHLQSTGPSMGATGITKLFAPVTALSMKVPGLSQSAADGARPTLMAVTTPTTGAYFGPGGPLEITGAPKKARMTGRARDAAVAARLWQRSEELTGLSFS